MGQYAKIVEDLKTQLNECKTKITSLEEENSALKNQVELDDQQRANASTMQQNHNHEEMELLKAQLAELEVIWRNLLKILRKLNLRKCFIFVVSKRLISGAFALTKIEIFLRSRCKFDEFYWKIKGNWIFCLLIINISWVLAIG